MNAVDSCRWGLALLLMAAAACGEDAKPIGKPQLTFEDDAGDSADGSPGDDDPGPGDGNDASDAADSTSSDAADGVDARDGSDATDGVDGPDGVVDGLDSEDGVDAEDGVLPDGTDAADGLDAVDTADGVVDGLDAVDAVDAAVDAVDTADGQDAVDGQDGLDGVDGQDGQDAQPGDPCKVHSDCDDGNACTKDRCSFFSETCSFEVIAGCDAECESNQDCDDDDVCTTDVCQGGVCASLPGNCECQKDVDCADDDACTADSCSGGICHHAAIPECGACQILYSTAFDGAEAIQGWAEYSQTTEVAWQVVTKRSHSPPSALYMGNPATWNYVNKNDEFPYQPLITEEGLRVPGFAVPSGGTTTVRFQVWMDIEDCQGASEDQFDQFFVSVDQGNDNYPDIFQKCDVDEPWGAWKSAETDLGDWEGKTIQGLWFYFDSGNAAYNEGEGIYVDDLVVEFCPD